MDMETTICKKHGLQPAVGNNDECEKCLIEDKEEQMRKLEDELDNSMR